MKNDDENRKAGSDCQKRLVSGSSGCVTIHNHEASMMWLAVLVAVVMGSIAAGNWIDTWKQVELEKIRAQQRVQIVEEAGNVSC